MAPRARCARCPQILPSERGVPVARPEFSLGFPLKTNFAPKRGVPVAPRSCPPSVLTDVLRQGRGVRVAPAVAPQARYRNRCLGSLAGMI